MNHDKYVIILTFMALSVIAGTGYFIDFVKRNTMEPLDEIEVQVRPFTPILDLIIMDRIREECRNELGKLGEFLDCKDRIELEYR